MAGRRGDRPDPGTKEAEGRKKKGKKNGTPSFQKTPKQKRKERQHCCIRQL